MTPRCPRATWVWVACAGLALGACSSLPSSPAPATEDIDVGPPLSGEALQQRKSELRRAARDMVHLGATLESLRLHRNGVDRALVDHVYGFFGEHLDPLLASSTASEDPSLAALAAGAHLLKADVLAEMGERSGVDRVVRDIERRFAGRDSMLVDYPPGSQTTLRKALEFVRERGRGKQSGRWAQPLAPF